MRIVIVADHASVTGGQARVAIDNALGLARRGVPTIYFAAAGPVDARLRDAGVDVVCLDQADILSDASRLAAVARGLWNRPAAAALSALLARFSPGECLVHVHGWAKALSPSIAPAIRASGHPAIATLHEFFLFCPNGGFFDYQRAEVCERRPLSLDCLSTQCDARRASHKAWRVARQAIAAWPARMPRLFSDLIVLSRTQRDMVARLVPQGVRLRLLANPVDAVDLGPKTEPVSGDFLFVGRLSPEKGAALFAEAATRVGATPTLIGDGPLADVLRARFPQARMLGWRSPDEVRAAMRAARALVFPSVWRETFGLAPYEALALGTPVVVADGSAAREAVVENENGLLFPIGRRRRSRAKAFAHAGRRPRRASLSRRPSPLLARAADA